MVLLYCRVTSAFPPHREGGSNRSEQHTESDKLLQHHPIVIPTIYVDGKLQGAVIRFFTAIQLCIQPVQMRINDFRVLIITVYGEECGG